MAGPTHEEDVILDANAAPVYRAFENIERRMREIALQVKNINTASAQGAKQFDAVLNQTAKELARTMGAMKTLANANNMPGGRIQDLNANRRLAQDTKAAINYARELNVARNSAEALEARINKLNKTIAAQGTVTLRQRDQLDHYEKTSQALKRLDSQYEQLTRKASRLGGTDISAELRAVTEAREKLQSALMAPRRMTVAGEMKALDNAQLILAEKIAAARSVEAQNLRTAMATRKELAVADAKAITDAGALSRARQQSDGRITDLRNRLRTASQEEQREIHKSLAIEQARGKQLEANRREIEKIARAEAAGNSGARGGGGPTGINKYLPAGGLTAVATRTLAYGGVAGAAFGAVNLVSQNVRGVIEFEDELAKLQAIANATDFQMQSLKASIFDVGATSRYSLTDLTSISQTLAQAGVGAGAMEDVLRSVTTLATASGSTPDEAVNLVTSALGSFQLQATEASRVADLMTSALNRTKLTVQQTGQAIQYVGATAFEQNISMETLLATVGAIAQAGVRSGSTIGTGFRQFLVDLQNPSKKLQEQLDLLNISAADVDVSVRGLEPVLNTLREKGFGAAQAYAGLETRAAAFYLVAKNNVDIMDELQVSFAQSGAAALANERAMNSLSAQWQRFKNILFEDFSEGMAVPLDILKDTLQLMSDRIDEMRNESAKLAAAQAGGLGGYQQQYGDVSGTIAYSVNTAGQRVLDEANNDLRVLMNGFGLGDLGDRWMAYTKNVTQAGVATRDVASAVAESGEKVEATRGTVDALEKEMQRLSTQQEEYRSGAKNAAVDIISLGARFQGLAVYLTNTGTRYDDLTQALRRYRLEQLKLLSDRMVGENTALAQQREDARARGSQISGDIRSNPAAMAALSPAARAAVAAPRRNQNTQILSDEADKQQANNPELARQLRNLVAQAGTMSSAEGQITANRSLIGQANAQRTPFGQQIGTTITSVTGGIARLGSLEGAAAQREAKSNLNQLDWLLGEVNRRLDLPGNSSERGLLLSTRTEIAGLRQQIKATMTPTAAETKEAQRAAREAARTEQRPLITRGDVISSVRTVMGDDVKIGSGYRTQAQQDAIPSATKARVSDHTTGIGQDFPFRAASDAEGKRMADRVRQRLKDDGIDAQVIYENGKNGNGTGAHIHVGVRKNLRRGREGNGEARADVSNEKIALEAVSAELDDRIKDLSRVTSDTLIDTLGENAMALLDQWEKQTRDLAEADIAAQGMTANAATQRRAAVERQIKQKRDETAGAIVQSLIKSVDRQFAAIQQAADLATAPARQATARAQGAVSGLGLYSNRFAPDYVSQLASNRVARAQEAELRTRAATLPGQISNDEAALDAFRTKTAGYTGAEADAAQQQIEKLTLAIADLREEKANLDEQLAAGGLVPQSIGDGALMAIQAYQEANNLGGSFASMINGEWGDALNTLSGGINTFFSDIITGSQGALGAFASFTMSMIKYVQQLAAKMLASQVLGVLLKFGASFLGSKVGPSAGISAEQGLANYGPLNMPGVGQFNGGPAGEPVHLLGGGQVMNGNANRDSVDARLARGEWVVRKKAVDSVGSGFMARLNANGAGALAAMGAIPRLPEPAHQETNVYVVKEGQRPQIGKNDILLTVAEDILGGGETMKLIKHVSNGG